MNTKNRIKTLLPLAIVVMVIGPMAATLQGSDYFSINFTSDFLPWDGPDEWRGKQHFATLDENGIDQVAGYDRWATNGWLDVLAPWIMPDELDPPEEIVPVTITSTSGATATFTFNNCRNGWTLSAEPNESGVGNNEMMNACAWGTEDDAEGSPSSPWDKQIFDMEISDIPFSHYDAIFYFGAQTGQYEDGTTKFKLNGAMQDIIVMNGYGHGTFTEAPDLNGDPNGGNYMLVENLTGSTLTVQLWGVGWQHVGLCGFQFGEYDPNTPTVNAGTDDKIILSGMDVDMDASIVNNDTYEPQRSLDFVWTADPCDGVVISDPCTLNPTVTVTNPDPNNPSTYELRLTAWLVNPSGPNEKPAIDTMTIDVYSDACKAIIASGEAAPYDSGDINTDCITSLKDIAITGEKWIVDYQLTEPVAKP